MRRRTLTASVREQDFRRFWSRGLRELPPLDFIAGHGWPDQWRVPQSWWSGASIWPLLSGLSV